MSNVTRISPEEAKSRVITGEALLVCAYDSEEKFSRNHLEGAISQAEFLSRLPGVSKDTELIFYCG